MTDEDLDLIETERLVDALGRRFDTILFVTTRAQNSGGDGAAVWWRGGWVAALGLAHFAAHDITHSENDRIRSKDD